MASMHDFLDAPRVIERVPECLLPAGVSALPYKSAYMGLALSSRGRARVLKPCTETTS